MHSGSNSSGQGVNFNLQADPSAGENKIERYIKTMQANYNDVQRMFTPDNYFTGSLYSNCILTFDQLQHIQYLHKKPGGKAEALSIIQNALLRIGNEAADPFIRALVDPGSRQDALARFIDRERADQLINDRDL